MRAPDISYVTDIWFGRGAAREVPALLAHLAASARSSSPTRTSPGSD